MVVLWCLFCVCFLLGLGGGLCLRTCRVCCIVIVAGAFAVLSCVVIACY